MAAKTVMDLTIRELLARMPSGAVIMPSGTIARILMQNADIEGIAVQYATSPSNGAFLVVQAVSNQEVESGAVGSEV